VKNTMNKTGELPQVTADEVQALVAARKRSGLWAGTGAWIKEGLQCGWKSVQMRSPTCCCGPRPTSGNCWPLRANCERISWICGKPMHGKARGSHQA
jgi:hypothetical protein